MSTRVLSQNEAFSRATMFLAVLSGAVLALAPVAQAKGFDEGFTTFALLILPIVLFVGIATFMRLVAINRGALATVAVQLLYQYRAVVKPRGEGSVSFPNVSSRG